MALKTLNPGGQRLPRNSLHSVRFNSDDSTKYKSSDSPQASILNFYEPSQPGIDSGAPSPDSMEYQPALQRLNINDQRIKLLQAINQVVEQRADLEANHSTLSNLLEELRRKLKRKVDECHAEKRDKIKLLKQANHRLEKEKFGIMTEIEHLERHLKKEEAHHLQHARKVAAQAIQSITKTPADQYYAAPCSISSIPNMVSRNVAKNAPSKIADNKLAAARLMRDIAELRHRVAQVEARLAHELKRKRQAENDISRLRKELSYTKSNVASLRLPPTPSTKQCSRFA